VATFLGAEVMIPAVCRGIVVAVCLASATAYRIPIQASLKPEVDRRSLFGTVAGALALWGARPAVSSAAIGLSREYIDPDLQFQLKYPLGEFKVALRSLFELHTN
jgi:hypothetical protein